MIDLNKHFFSLYQKIEFLRQDFVGVAFNLPSVTFFIEELFFATTLLLLIFLFGNKVRKVISIKGDKYENIFVNVALGYILIGTGIALLGIFSMLNFIFLMLFLFTITIFSIYPFLSTKKSVKEIIFILLNIICSIKKSWLNLVIFGFIFIAFLRLILPETGVDAIWYHTDYPREYLKHQSIMIEPKGSLYIITTPQIAQMFYVINEMFNLRDASRVLHFLFYIVVILLLYYIGSSKRFHGQGIYASLLFVTAPVIIRHTSTAYVDFQWIFLWLLAFWFLIKEKKLLVKNIIISSVFFGGLLATKIQSLVFVLPFLLIVLFTYRKEGIFIMLKNTWLFLMFSFAIPFIWYLRSYILAGNPFYPLFLSDEKVSSLLNLSTYISLNSILLRISNFFSILTISILSFIGMAYFLFKSKSFLLNNLKTKEFIFIAILFIEYFFLPPIYLLARHLIYFYSIFVLFLSIEIYGFVLNYKRAKYIILVFSFVILLYYFFTTLIMLPYGLGWADENKYLTRILEWDNSSYYDYDRKFSSYIKNSDKVVTYGVQGFYYADFNHVDIDYFFDDQKPRNLSALSENGITKLITKRGDVNWFCKEWKINDCNPGKYKLISSHSFTQQYLYSLINSD